MAEYININGTWVQPSSKYVNINGTWVGTNTYANINGTWTNVNQYGGGPVDFKLSMSSIQFGSYYGGNYIYSNYCKIASGYSGAGTCAIRSSATFSLKAGDTISASVLHAVLPNGGSFNTSTYGQGGRVFLSTNSYYSTSGTNIYYSARTPGKNTYNTYSYTCTSALTNVYLWIVLDYTSSSGDTYMQVNNVSVNGTTVYP